MRTRTTLRRALDDPKLLGGILAGESRHVWRILLIAAMGEQLDADERVLFKQITGRDHEPGQRVEELIGVVGRRGGKSRAIATLATYIAGLHTYDDVLVPGETGVVLVIAPDQRQAGIVLNYVDAAFRASPILRQLITNRTADTLTLSNNISVEVRAASFRRLRGPTYAAVIADEAAFWRDENYANPDSEILNAVRPGLATTGGPLIIISSPYSKSGVLWEAYRRHYGPAGDPSILVAQGSSRTFNATLPQSVVDRAMERDPASARAEFLAQFRDDISAFVPREAVLACVDSNIRERPYVSGLRYVGFVDPSGGSHDSMTLAIGHPDRDAIVIDVLREITAPFDPESAADEFARTLKNYHLRCVVGDRYAGQWCAQAFRKRNIEYEPSDLPKSALYIDLLPKLNGRTIRLLDHSRTVNQIAALERRTQRGGKDSIDHPPNAHDDLANVIAGVASIASVPHKELYTGGLTNTPAEMATLRRGVVPIDPADLNPFNGKHYAHRALAAYCACPSCQPRLSSTFGAKGAC